MVIFRPVHPGDQLLLCLRVDLHYEAALLLAVVVPLPPRDRLRGTVVAGGPSLGPVWARASKGTSKKEGKLKQNWHEHSWRSLPLWLEVTLADALVSLCTHSKYKGGYPPNTFRKIGPECFLVLWVLTSVVFGLFHHWFQWFSMVWDHCSNDGMVSMDRSDLQPFIHGWEFTAEVWDPSSLPMMLNNTPNTSQVQYIWCVAIC